MVQDGYEYSVNFESALAKEERRIKKHHPYWDPEYYYNYQYFASGLYSKHISLSLLYSAADVMVAPSIEENLSLSIMESLSCGTPVVGSQSEVIRI